MKTVNKYGLEYAGPRSRSGWKRRLGCWLWSLVWMVLVSLVLWGLFAWATGRVTGLTGVTALTMARPASAMRLAGFGVPEWVAFGVVGTLVMVLLARIGWGAMQEAFRIGELSEPPEHDGLEVEVGGQRRAEVDETTLEAWAVAVETAMGQIEREHECEGDGCRVCDALTSVGEAPVSKSQALPVSKSSTKEGVVL